MQVMGCTPATWMMQLDADAVFTNYAIGPEALLAMLRSEHPHIDRLNFIFSADYNGPAQETPINAGVFLARNTDGAMETMAELYNNKSLHGPPEDRWWEQTALNKYVQRDREAFETHATIVPSRIFNNHFLHYKRGDFIVHYAGGPPEKYSEIRDAISPGDSFPHSPPQPACCSSGAPHSLIHATAIFSFTRLHMYVCCTLNPWLPVMSYLRTSPAFCPLHVSLALKRWKSPSMRHCHFHGMSALPVPLQVERWQRM